MPAAIMKDSFLRFMLIKEVPLYLFKEAFVISAGYELAGYEHYSHLQNKEPQLVLAIVRHVVLRLIFKYLLHQRLKFVDVLFRESPQMKITMIGIPLLIGNFHL